MAELKSISVAGVNVDPTNPPKREDLVKLAHKSKRHASNPNADKEINSEINKSGLYPGVAAKVEPSKGGSKP